MDANSGSPEQKAFTPPAPLDPNLVARKIQKYLELCDLSMELAIAGIKYRNPAASPEELRRLFAERLAVFRENKWRRHE